MLYVIWSKGWASHTRSLAHFLPLKLPSLPSIASPMQSHLRGCCCWTVGWVLIYFCLKGLNQNLELEKCSSVTDCCSSFVEKKASLNWIQECTVIDSNQAALVTRYFSLLQFMPSSFTSWNVWTRHLPPPSLLLPFLFATAGKFGVSPLLFHEPLNPIWWCSLRPEDCYSSAGFCRYRKGSFSCRQNGMHRTSPWRDFSSDGSHTWSLSRVISNHWLRTGSNL